MSSVEPAEQQYALMMTIIIQSDMVHAVLRTKNLIAIGTDIAMSVVSTSVLRMPGKIKQMRLSSAQAGQTRSNLMCSPSSEQAIQAA